MQLGSFSSPRRLLRYRLWHASSLIPRSSSCKGRFCQHPKEPASQAWILAVSTTAIASVRVKDKVLLCVAHSIYKRQSCTMLWPNNSETNHMEIKFSPALARILHHGSSYFHFMIPSLTIIDSSSAGCSCFVPKMGSS